VVLPLTTSGHDRCTVFIKERAVLGATLKNAPVGPVVVSNGSISPDEDAFCVHVRQTDPGIGVSPVAVIELLPDVGVELLALDDDQRAPSSLAVLVGVPEPLGSVQDEPVAHPIVVLKESVTS